MSKEAKVIVTLNAENKGTFEMFQQLKREQEKAAEGLKNFNNKAQQAKGGMGDFGAMIGAGTKALGALGLSLGAGKLALETFKGVVSSTQATGDAWAKSTEGLKASMNEFFQSIATADFSNLINNMQDAYEQGVRLSGIMDSLGDKVFAYEWGKGGQDLQLTKLEDTIRNSKNPEERKKAFEEFRKIADEQKKEAEKLGKSYDEATNVSFGKAIGSKAKGATLTELKNGLDTYVKLQGGDPELLRQYKQYQKDKKDKKGAEKSAESLQNTTAHISGGGLGIALVNSMKIKEASKKAAEDKVKKTNKALYLAFEAMDKVTDEEREALQELNSKKIAMEMTAYNSSKRLDRLGVRANKEDKPTRVHVAKASKAYQWTQEDTEKANAIAKVPLSPYLPQERVKAKLEELQKYIKEQEDKLAITVKGSVEFDKIKKDIETKKAEAQSIESANAPGLQMSKIAERAKEIDSITFTAPQGVEDFTNGIQSMQGAIDNVANSFGAFTSLIDGSNKSFAEWLGSASRALTSVLPLIEALTAKQKVSVAVNTADAAAKGASAVASTPIVGPVLAIGAVASIVGALASVAKFESGGIVGGNSYYGDKILARVNSGELILNNKQQRALYNGLSQKIDRTQHINVGGSFKIQGKDLVLAYNRTNKQLARN